MASKSSGQEREIEDFGGNSFSAGESRGQTRSKSHDGASLLRQPGDKGEKLGEEQAKEVEADPQPNKWSAKGAIEALIRARRVRRERRNSDLDLGRQLRTETSEIKVIETDNENSLRTVPQETNKKTERTKTGNPPPTFGETPSKVKRLPYYTVSGRACNVAIVKAADRHRANRELLPNCSLSGSSSSPLDLDGTSGDSELSASRTSRKRLNSRNYSNISNLFPGRPIDGRRTPKAAEEHQRTNSSSSGLNQPPESSIRGVSRESSRNFATSTPSLDRLNSVTKNQRFIDRDSKQAVNQRPQNMRRQNSLIGISSKGNVSNPTLSGFGNRPASVSGQYGLGGRIKRRSPSASSLHHGANGALGSHSLYDKMNDPDCPVHGHSPYELEKSAPLTSPMNDSGIGYPSYGRRRQATNYPERMGPEYRASRAGTYASAYSLHSPSSPTDAAPYYDQSSRFSVFQTARDTDGPRPRSSLAPPKEQLRRILGYQPASKPVHLHPQWAYSRPFHHLMPAEAEWTPAPIDNDTGQYIDDDEVNELNASLLQFLPFNRLEDTQAIRAVDFHPSGQVYAVGSNSRALRICAYPAASELNQFGSNLLNSPGNSPNQLVQTPRVLFKFLQVHRGSIYCVRFNRSGQLLATGSNDQTVHIVKYNSRIHSPEGDEYRLTMHDGTVRDVCFIDDQTNGNSLLLSAGGGDNKIYLTDCDTITPYQSFAGHTQMVMALHHIAGAQFVSASQDKTMRFWDLRTRQCTSIVSAPPVRPGSRWNGGPGAPVCAVQADHSGRLVVSGHSDSTCMLYDIRGSRIIQTFKPHEDEIRTISFSPRSYYLLTGGYDGRIVLSDLQGDLNQALPSVCVAESDDKIIQARWHPTDFTFVSTSANKSATLWIPPTENFA